MFHRVAVLRSQCKWTRIFKSLTPLWRWGLNLDLKGIERVIIHLSVPENYNFDTIISDYFYRLPFTTSSPPPLQVLEVHINAIRSISIHITESKIHISYLKNHDSTLMLSYIIFTSHPFQQSHKFCFQLIWYIWVLYRCTVLVDFNVLVI